MADVRPFRGVRYNQQIVGDLASVISPPYDVITPRMEEELHRRSQFNFVRLEYGRPGRNGSDKYIQAKDTLEQWLRQGVFQVDEMPALYLHDHYFTYQGKEFRRRGIIAGVRLEEWSRGVVLPHENTMARSKDDRLSLLGALQANTSSVFALFDDPKQRISALLAKVEKEGPVITLASPTEGRHNVWAITRPEIVGEITASLAPKPLYIADGHHRYESALNYQREISSRSGSIYGDEKFNFVMMTLVDFADPGLIMLPTHRLVRGISEATLAGLRTALAAVFEIEERSLDAPDVWSQVDGLLAGGGQHQARLALFGLSPTGLLVLKLRDLGLVERLVPSGHGEIYQRLDVSILDHVILEQFLGRRGGNDEESLAFSHDREEAVSRVRDGEYQLAFLLAPLKVTVIKEITDAGERMPRKSTYFYPKLPSGLVFHRLC
jgi:uncharacterized protein (DUF1015 family)